MTDLTEIIATKYRFENFTLDLKNRQLSRNGKIISLTSRYFDVLSLLVSRHGRLTTRQEIFSTVWGDVIVTDTTLSQCIKDIRKQLGDHAGNPRFIKTVPKHGYVFIADVHEEDSGRQITPAEVIEEPLIRPYKFLDYFTENDTRIFFGRDEESRMISSKILAHRTFVLHGRSGVGKSSVIRAGVVPLIRNQGHQVFIVRSFIDPLHQIREALAPELRGLKMNADASLTGQLVFLSNRYPDQQFIFVFDQFEEFFSLLSEGHRTQFISDIAQIWDREGLPLRLVFVLREDLLAEMSQLKAAIPDIFHYEFRLKRLNLEQAARAIMEPARVAGCTFRKPLVDRLLTDLSDHGNIDPPQLQIVCDALYDERTADNRVTLEEYNRLGGSQKILAGYLERVLERFGPSDLLVVKNILTHLISESKQRLVLRQAELEVRISSQVTRETVSTGLLITELIASRILRCRQQEGESWIELAHDFLIPEISSWITVEEYTLKRAYGIVERALENFRAHNLLIDNDALDLVLPFGSRLGLTAEESNLLARSLLSRGRAVPDWLADNASELQDIILENIQSPLPELRIAAIQSCRKIRNGSVKEKLMEKAFWDEDLMVRKAASIAYAEWFGPLDQAQGGERRSGLKRRAISMAFIRDHDKNLIHLSQQPVPVAVLVVLGLMLVRFKRHSMKILMQILGGTAGAALAGLVVGSVIGLALLFARPAAAYDRVSLFLVLTSLGTVAGAFGGFGISAGMVFINHVSFRHSQWWSILGACAGGAVMGAVMNILGVDILRSLFGHHLRGITGAVEGAFIGTGLAVGKLFVPELKGTGKRWGMIAGAALGAMVAAISLTLIGGNLFSGSLDIVARSFADSQLKFDTLASLFGESQFGRLSRLALGGMEGLLFGAFLTAGIELLSRESSRT